MNRIQFQADDFFRAHELLAKDNIKMGAPSVVCLAFSLELQVKALYSALEKDVPKGHSILKLYKSLPNKVQDRVYNHHAIQEQLGSFQGDIFNPKRFTKSYTYKHAFIEEIKAVSDGFEKWRYAHEHASLKYNVWFALLLCSVLKSISNDI